MCIYTTQCCTLVVKATLANINQSSELISSNYSKGLSIWPILFLILLSSSSNSFSLPSGAEIAGDSSQILSLHASCPSPCQLCGTLWWRSGQVRSLTLGAGRGARGRCECGALNRAGPPGRGPSVGGVQGCSCAAQGPLPPPAPAVALRRRSAHPEPRCAPPVRPAVLEVHEPQPDRHRQRERKRVREWMLRLKEAGMAK